MLNAYFARGNKKVLLARRNLSAPNYRKTAVFRQNLHSGKRKILPLAHRFVKFDKIKETNKKGIRNSFYGHPNN